MYNLPTDEVVKLVNTTRIGLMSKDAAERLKNSGKNIILEGKRTPAILRFLMQFKNIIIIILIAAFILSIVVGIIDKNPTEFISAGLIWVVILFNSIIGFTQGNKAEKAVAALKNASQPNAKVIRDGKSTTVKVEDLVVGDLVIIEAGDVIPADLRLIETASLQIEESALTGESVPVEKHSKQLEGSNISIGDQSNMAFLGGTVTYGRGKGIVIATAMETEIGKIAHHISTQTQPQTPLTKRLHKTHLIIAIVVAVVALFIFVSRLITGDKIVDSFMLTMAIAVCAVPEAMPTCITITMALGTRNMSRQKAIIRNLPAVETLGSTEIICSDKTGTLTLNKMTVKKLYTLGKNKQSRQSVFEINREDIDFVDYFRKTDNFRMLTTCMLLCNDTQTRYEAGSLQTIGDPTETALVHCANIFNWTKDYADNKYTRVDELPFSSERKMMSTIHKMPDDTKVMYSKGGIDNILKECTKIYDNGKVRTLTAKDTENIINTGKTFAQDALRVLAYAYKPFDSAEKAQSKDESELIFIGLTGMMDPPREEVFESIRVCKEAGIIPIMITGDHKDTAFAIAKAIGITQDEGQVITGTDLNQMNDDILMASIDLYRVYARVNPEHKVRIVNAFRAKNKIVAMTGDGVNDAASIKAADIGIGMGITGTDVTKKVADVILTDDNFATIVGAVKEGRRTYSNIKKIIVYLLGLSMTELILLTLMSAILRIEFFNPMLILWINIVTDTLPVLALGTLKPEKNIMKQPPNTSRGSLFKGHTGLSLLVYSACQVAIILSVYFVSKNALGFTAIECATMSYLTLAIIETIHAYNLYSLKETMFQKSTFSNKWLNWAVIVSLIIIIGSIVIPFGGFHRALGITQLTGVEWAFAFGMGMLIIPFAEIYKLICRKHDKKKKHKKKNARKVILAKF